MEIKTNVIDESVEDAVIKYLDTKEWNRYKKEYIQEYGERVLLRKRKSNLYEYPDETEHPLFKFACKVASRISRPDQITFQSISPKRGTKYCVESAHYEECVICVALLSDVTLKFRSVIGETSSILIPRNGILIIEGAYRMFYMRKADKDITSRILVTFRGKKRSSPISRPRSKRSGTSHYDEFMDVAK